MSIWLWAALIMILIVIALWADVRFGWARAREEEKQPQTVEIDKAQLPRIEIPNPRGIGQEQLLTGAPAGDGEIYGYVLFNGEFRPMKLTEDFMKNGKNGKIPVQLAHFYYRNGDRPIWVDANLIYMAEAYPGHYARLVMTERVSNYIEKQER